MRTLWDKLMFVIVIKRRARVPATDSFVARRIAGPGLASNYFYQVRTKLEVYRKNVQQFKHCEAWSGFSVIVVMATCVCMQILPQQALAAVEAQIELHELKAWQVAEETKVAQPRKAFE